MVRKNGELELSERGEIKRLNAKPIKNSGRGQKKR